MIINWWEKSKGFDIIIIFFPTLVVPHASLASPHRRGVPEALLQSRPLPHIPDLPSEAAEGAGAAASTAGTPLSLDTANRWTSKENLLAHVEDEDPQLFVALYDFQAAGDNQLGLKKGREAKLFTYLRYYIIVVYNRYIIHVLSYIYKYSRVFASFFLWFWNFFHFGRIGLCIEYPMIVHSFCVLLFTFQFSIVEMWP